MKNRIKIGTMLLVSIPLVSLFAEVGIPVFAMITHYFFDPLGPTDSSSFEYLGPSIFQTPYWNVSGGMHFLRTDLNDDGICNDTDLNMFLDHYGSSSGYDFDNDGNSDFFDLVIMSKNLGKIKRSIHGSYSWFIGGGSGDYALSRYVEDNCISALRPEYAIEKTGFVFAFWYYAEKNFTADAACRAEAIVDYGTWNRTYGGVWVVPMYNNWTAVYVRGYCTIDVEAIKVIIRIRNLEAYIDCATFAIFDHCQIETEYGSLALGVSTFSYRQDPGMTLDAIVRAVPAMYVQAAEGYKIKWIELKVKWIPNGGGGVFNLNIPYSQQGNNEGHVVDPAAVEKQQNDEVIVGGVIVSLVGSTVLTFGVGAIFQGVVSASTIAVLEFVASTTFGAVLGFVLPYWATDPDHRTADGGALGDAVWEHWPYPDYEDSLIWWEVPKKFVESANAVYDLDWTFDSDSGTEFIVDITATVCFAEPIWSLEGFWYLKDRATYTVLTSIFIRA